MTISTAELDSRLREIESIMQQNLHAHDSDDYIAISQEYAKLSRIRELQTDLLKYRNQLNELQNLDDPELQEMAVTETEELTQKLAKLEKEYELLTLDPLPDDDKSCIIEIRAGAGGTEAALFAEELYRMYLRYCNNQHWNVEVSEINRETEAGIKTAILIVNTKGSYGKLRFESGVHRVQRVPATESSGRIHTSTASVAILPRVEDAKVIINDKDIKIDVYRSSGPGGQSVNTTDSAVRITHIPTGIVVTCQDGKSQLKNKEKAMSILAAKLYAAHQEEVADKQAEQRSAQIQGGDRSAKIRTYNFPQGRITDHRIKETWHNVSEILDGNLDEVIEAVQKYMRQS